MLKRDDLPNPLPILHTLTAHPRRTLLANSSIFSAAFADMRYALNAGADG